MARGSKVIGHVGIKCFSSHLWSIGSGSVVARASGTGTRAFIADWSTRMNALDEEDDAKHMFRGAIELFTGGSGSISQTGHVSPPDLGVIEHAFHLQRDQGPDVLSVQVQWREKKQEKRPEFWGIQTLWASPSAPAIFGSRGSSSAKCKKGLAVVINTYNEYIIAPKQTPHLPPARFRANRFAIYLVLLWLATLCCICFLIAKLTFSSSSSSSIKWQNKVETNDLVVFSHIQLINYLFQFYSPAIQKQIYNN